ncbi:hypothetical protein SNE40_003642 [Patella caerulea]|uniref:Tc1-like transposase DDE domain-containing protein n=1 Tax=Patella caerulea TaxID=87958 RepID=A0AAN8KEL3_PATCE
MPATRIPHLDKLKIVELHKKDWKCSAIHRYLNQSNVNVSLSGVKYTVTAYIEGRFDNKCVLTEKTHHFNNLCSDDIVFIDNEFQQNPAQSARDIQKTLSAHGTDTSISTVRRAIDFAGYTSTKPRYCQLIRDQNKEKRVEFCRHLLETNDQFDNVIFTDECSIQLHDNKTVAYRQKDQRAPQQCRPKHPYKVHLWGGISRKGKSQLLIFDGIMDSVFYTEEILKKTLLPFINKRFHDGHRFQQDNDPKHTSRLAKTFMEDNNINWWCTPPESPDLNPIEMVWNMLKRYVSKNNPTTKEELCNYCQDFWYNVLTRDICNRFIDHMYKVVPVVVVVGGKATADMPKRLFGSERSFGKDSNHFNQKLLNDPKVRKRLQ